MSSRRSPSETCNSTWVSLARSRLTRWLWNLLPDKSSIDSRQLQILTAIHGGNHLKGHRYLDGTKAYRLHDAHGAVIAAVDGADVSALEARGMIASNMKFPASVYLLTADGAKMVRTLSAQRGQPSAANATSARLPWRG